MPGKRKVVKTNKNGVKTKQVIKDGVVKKTVTRTPGGVEKEIERGNKRIDVRKYKDEGVKTRTVTNMKKNEQYKENNVKAIKEAAMTGMLSGSAEGAADFMSNLKGSTFKNMPKAMYDNANSSKNTQIDGKMSESKPLTTPQKKLIAMPYEILKGTLDKMSTDGGFKTTKTTGKITGLKKNK